MAHDGLKLPFDVLVAIMAVTSSRFARSAMMATCRMLNDAGAKYILSGTVSLCNTRQLNSFVLFILAQEETRMRHFRILDIQLEDVSPQTPSHNLDPRGSVAEVARKEGVHDDLYILLTRPSLSLEVLILRRAEQTFTKKIY
ncbi:hypothetical protein C8T65DRAFT_728009, partial [Cerioporus squamosus]